MHSFVDRYTVFSTEDLSFIFRISQWGQLFHLRDLSQPVLVDVFTDGGEQIRLQLRYDEIIKQVDVVYADGRIAFLNLTELHLGATLF
jgi:hypothetical protein